MLPNVGRLLCDAVLTPAVLSLVFGCSVVSPSNTSAIDAQRQASDLPRPDAAPSAAYGGPGSQELGDCTILSFPRTYNRVGGGTWTTLGLTARYSTTESRDNWENSPENMLVVRWIPMPNVHRDESFNCVQDNPPTVPAGVFIDAGERITPADDPWRGFSGFNSIATPLDGCGRDPIPQLVPASNYLDDAITDYFAQDDTGAFTKCRNHGAPGHGGGSGGLGVARASADLDSLGLSAMAREQFAQVIELIRRGDLAALSARVRSGEFDALRTEGRPILEAYSASLGAGAENPATSACIAFAGCITAATAHTAATLGALSRIDPILQAANVGQKRSNWLALVAVEVTMVLAAYSGLPACMAASVDPTCPPGSQAAAAVAISVMIMEWSLIIPVDIVLFICSLAGC